MGRPYSDLEKQCVAILANGGNPASSSDEAVAKYWAWKINPSSSAHQFTGDRATSKRSTGRKLDTKYIQPFDGIVATATLIEVSISQRAMTDISETVRNTFGFQTPSGTNQKVPLKRFKPAKVYYRTGAAETSAERTSRITGRKYKSYYSASDNGYSAPFGLVGSDTELQRRTAIKTALGATINLITFTPQVYRSAG